MGDIPERRSNKPPNTRGAAAVDGLRGRRHYRKTARRASSRSEAVSAGPRLRPQGKRLRGQPTPRGCRRPTPGQRGLQAMRSAVIMGGHQKQPFGRSDDSE